MSEFKSVETLMEENPVIWKSKVEDFKAFLFYLKEEERQFVMRKISDGYCLNPVGCGRILKPGENCHCENDE